MINLNPTANPQYKWNDYCVRNGRVLVAVVYGLPEHRQKEVDIYGYCETVDFDKAQDALAVLVQNIYHSGKTGWTFVVATHNTALISNDILRPDCYFVWNEEKQCAVSFDNLTNKELRLAHNIEKMFRAGDFSSADEDQVRKFREQLKDGSFFNDIDNGDDCGD